MKTYAKGLKDKIAELKTFQRKDFDTRGLMESFCKEDLGKALQEKEIVALNKSITSIANTVDKNVSWESLAEAAGSDFFEIKGKFKEIRDLLKETYLEFEILVQSLEQLKRGVLSDALLENIKEMNCFTFEPHQLHVHSQNCEFLGEQVNCLIIFKQLPRR